jgi:hypothetical protein
VIASGDLPAFRFRRTGNSPWLVERTMLERWIDTLYAQARAWVATNPRGGDGMWPGKVVDRTDDAGVLGRRARRLRRLPGALVGRGPTPSTLSGRTWQRFATRRHVLTNSVVDRNDAQG